MSVTYLWNHEYFQTAESPYNIYDHSAICYTSHAHCIGLLHPVGNKIGTPNYYNSGYTLLCLFNENLQLALCGQSVVSLNGFTQLVNQIHKSLFAWQLGSLRRIAIQNPIINPKRFAGRFRLKMENPIILIRRLFRKHMSRTDIYMCLR